MLFFAKQSNDPKFRKTIIAIFAVILCLIFLIGYIIVATVTAIITSVCTFLVEDVSLVAAAVTAMDAARSAYVEEQMADYRNQRDPNGNPYRNVSLQWENGFSNNDKEILAMVSCSYYQNWDSVDMTPLSCWMVLKSITFRTTETGPYSCGGCLTRRVCNGHRSDMNDALDESFFHSDNDPECDNYSEVRYCPGDHYDLMVTASLPGCRNYDPDSGAIRDSISQWDYLIGCESSNPHSAVMESYLLAVEDTPEPSDWEGWSDLNIDWATLLVQTDWYELYGVIITPHGAVVTDVFRPTEDFVGNGQFVLPIASYTYISCHFGDPDGIDGSTHKGMDFAAPYGTPILAASDGVVVTTGFHPSWGNYVKIYHGQIDGQEIYTLYAHCSSLGVSAGQTVGAGQPIAYVGSTGASTGNHLHFEVYVNNTRVAPEGWL